MKKNGFKIVHIRSAAVMSIISFVLSSLFRLIGYSDKFSDPLFVITQVALPVISAALMIVVMLKFGRDALYLSTFPLAVGVLSFIFKLFIDPRKVSFLHHFAAIILYTAIIALWALTVFCVIKTKWILAVLFILPFIKHLLFDDLPVLLGRAAPVSSSVWLKEFSMLLTMLALSLYAMSFEKIPEAYDQGVTQP